MTSETRKSSLHERSELAEPGTTATDAATPQGTVRLEGSSELLRAREMPDFHLGDERTDVRGWLVYSNDAVLAGSVASLFVDMHTKAVRYLGVTLSDARSKLPVGEILVPVGSASRPDDRQVIVLRTLSYAQLVSAPRVPKRPVTRSDENATLGVYGMPTWQDGSPRGLYAGPNFEERRLFGVRT